MSQQRRTPFELERFSRTSRKWQVCRILMIVTLSICSMGMGCRELIGAEPLAKCKLHVVQNQSQARMMNQASIVLSEPAENTPAYRKGPANDWLVPEKVDANDPIIRGILLAPGGPLLVELHVRVDGRSFRERCETLIDNALKLNTEKKSKPVAKQSEPVLTAEKNSQNSEKTLTVSGSTNNKAPEVKNELVKLAKSSDNNAETPDPKKRDTKPLIGLTPTYTASTLANWLAAAEPVDRYEARWLIAQRANGPTLLELERFSTERSNAAPFVHFVDADGDGIVSNSEIKGATALLNAADFNEDGIVTLVEIEKSLSKRSSRYKVWHPVPLFFTIDEKTDWKTFGRIVKEQYAKFPEIAKTIDSESLKEIASDKPVLVAGISFGSDAEKNGIEVLNISSSKSDKLSKESLVNGTDGISLRLSHCDIELSASQPEKSSDILSISLGAIVEGSPLWNLVDANRDQRLSVRERANVVSILTGLDQNSDGNLSALEIPTRIRLAVALGSDVHNQLAENVAPIRQIDPKSSENAPAWFVDMDLDHDGEISEKEFIGDLAKFKELDLNKDSRISIKEGLQARSD